MTNGIKPVDLMKTPRPVVAIAEEYIPGQVIDFHDHPRAQLLYALSGVMTATTHKGLWVIPPFTAIWIPPNIPHKISASSHISLRSLYFTRGFYDDEPKGCCVISVSPLLRELILELVKMPRIYPLGGYEERLVALIKDLLQQMDSTPVNLPIPDDFRLKAIYRQLDKNPGDKRTLEAWGQEVGATRRTLTRLFMSETAMTFGHWKRQIILIKSLIRLAEGEPVTRVAMDMGYESSSAFIVMFKKALGKTPSKYFSTA